MSPRDRILARRAQFIAAAIVGIAGCSSETSSGSAQACLKVAPDASLDGGDARDAEPQPCLFAGPEDTSVRDADITDSTSDSADASKPDSGS